MIAKVHVLFLFIFTCSYHLVACSFSPKIPDGTVHCRTHSDCPSGFACIKSLPTDDIGVCCASVSCDDKPARFTDAAPSSSKHDGAWTTGNMSGGHRGTVDGRAAEAGRLGTGGITSQGGNTYVAVEVGGAIDLPTSGGALGYGGTTNVEGGSLSTGGVISTGGILGTAGTVSGSKVGGLVYAGGNAGSGGLPMPQGGNTPVPLDGGSPRPTGGSISVPVDSGIVPIPVDSAIPLPIDSRVLPPIPVPGIQLFTATPGSIRIGQAAVLNWKVRGPVRSLTIDHGIGNVANLESYRVMPLFTTTYTLLLNGTDAEQATVKVNLLPIGLPIPTQKNDESILP